MPDETAADWDDAELRAAVRAYLEMRQLDETGRPYSKTAIRRRLITEHLPSRSEGAVEFRMQNISAVMRQLNQTWIDGYKPAEHIGRSVEPRLRRLIQDELSRGRGDVKALREVCPSLDTVMGVKAVFNKISSYVMCFAGRGEPNASSYYYQAENAARSAVQRPFIIAIGGGKDVHPKAEGRVVSLAKVGTVYGPTALLLEDRDEIKRLAQWPVSVSLNEVWHFEGMPHLVDDLGLPDRTILGGAQDGIIRPEEKLERLWNALQDWPMTVASLQPSANFYDSGTPQRAMTMLPTIPSSQGAEEGERIWKLQRQLERDARLKAAAKRLNFERFGQYTCEACEYACADVGMFDVHHVTPLAVGPRKTQPEHLKVLCPTCHRRAHRAPNRLQPYTLSELRAWVGDGRP